MGWFWDWQRGVLTGGSFLAAAKTLTCWGKNGLIQEGGILYQVSPDHLVGVPQPWPKDNLLLWSYDGQVKGSPGDQPTLKAGHANLQKMTSLDFFIKTESLRARS